MTNLDFQHPLYAPTNTRIECSQTHSPQCCMCGEMIQKGEMYIRAYSFNLHRDVPESGGVTRLHYECSLRGDYKHRDVKVIQYARVNIEKGRIG